MHPSRFGLGHVTRLSQTARAVQLQKERADRPATTPSAIDAYRIVNRRMGVIGFGLVGMVLAMFAISAVVA